MDAKVTVKAVDQKTAITLLETMLERRGFDSVVNEKSIVENAIASSKPAKKANSAPAKKQKKELKAKTFISAVNGIGPNALDN